MNKKMKKLLCGILTAGLLWTHSVLTFAMEGTMKVELKEGSNQISLTGVDEAIIAVEITLNIREGSVEELEFTADSKNVESFVKIHGEQSLSIYVISDTVLNLESNTASLGQLSHGDGLEYTLATVKTVNFLQNSSLYEDISVVWVEDTTYVPNEDQETEDKEEPEEDSAPEDSTTGGNFPSSNGGSFGSSGNDVDSEEENPEEALDPETQARYDNLLATYGDIQHHWAQEYILYVMDKGYFYGISEDTFAPNQPMTRAMFVTVIHAVDGGYKTVDISHFTDMVMEDWFYPYVSWGVANGVAEGLTHNTFGPDVAITREEMAVMVYGYIQNQDFDLEQSQDDLPFADESHISNWAVKAVEYIRQCGIITGKDGNMFDPQGQATRGEVATIIKSLAEKIQ